MPADHGAEDDGRDPRPGEERGVGPERDPADVVVPEVPVQRRHDGGVGRASNGIAVEREPHGGAGSGRSASSSGARRSTVSPGIVRRSPCSRHAAG